MSDTDIYKKREPMPYGSQKPQRPKRRRRSSSHKRSFDDKERKRRSKNSGFRRLLHVYRKKESEKVFWWVVGGTTFVVLLLLAIWQFVITELILRAQEEAEARNNRAKIEMKQEAAPAEPLSAVE
jgi:flagellar biosynthesis/type III secretory pathway M-ring protein FliF/YscJ